MIELLLSLGQADPTLVTSDGRAPLSLARSERAIGLVSHALQAKQIRDSLRALQQTQPQLTQLTHTVKHGAENSYTVAVEGASSLDSSTDEAVAQVVIDRTSDGIVLANTTDGSKAEKSKQSAVEEEDSSSARRHSARRSAQLSTQVLSTLHSLANASPLTIDCLKRLGASVAQAEQQYDRIRKDPTVYEYYLFFIQSVSSAVLACQTIASGFVDDARVTSAEQIMGGIDMAAQAVSWMGAPLVTGIGKFLLGLANNFDRQRTIRRITTYFPSVDSHKFIEILARELTILLWKDIHAVLRETKKASKLSILNRVMRAVEWMNTSTNLSVVQGFACGHASLLIDTLMRSEQPFVVEYSHLPVLMEWTTGKDLIH